MLTFTSFGGAGTVTGSKHLITHNNTRILIDCGLFQGLKNLRELNWQALPVKAADIDAVVLTHAHLDHCGYLPRLVQEGFRGKIYATAATRDLAELILLDSAWLQEKDAEDANRYGYTRHKPALPLYTVKDAERTLEHFHLVPWHQNVTVAKGVQIYMCRAGHILGAASVQIDIAGQRLVFSGDLGRYNDAVMHDPESVEQADYIVIESTYGNRLHSPDDAVSALGEVIERTVSRGGTVVIPSFAVGRAQALIYDLWKLRQGGGLQRVPVYLDSPMAANATALLQRHLDDHKLSEAEFRAACAEVTYVQTAEESAALSTNRYPKVILSASGMATGGRVLHHIAAFGPDHRNTLLFSGYQAPGTRGRKLLDGARETRLHGRWVPINAELAELPMLSAHADANELMRWLGGFRHAPRQIFIVHGEENAAEALRERIVHELNWDARVPLQNQVYPLLLSQNEVM